MLSGEAAITQLGDTTQHGRRLDRSQIGVVVELVGPDGLLNQLTKNVFETALNAEMTEIGPVLIEAPRDTNGSFCLTGIDEIVLSVTAKGLTTGEVAAISPRPGPTNCGARTSPSIPPATARSTVAPSWGPARHRAPTDS